MKLKLSHLPILFACITILCGLTIGLNSIQFWGSFILTNIYFGVMLGIKFIGDVLEEMHHKQGRLLFNNQIMLKKLLMHYDINTSDDIEEIQLGDKDTPEEVLDAIKDALESKLKNIASKAKKEEQHSYNIKHKDAKYGEGKYLDLRKDDS